MGLSLFIPNEIRSGRGILDCGRPGTGALAYRFTFDSRLLCLQPMTLGVLARMMLGL